ncbi:MAG: fibronectin type III domain-containing protein [bacterium]
MRTRRWIVGAATVLAVGAAGLVIPPAAQAAIPQAGWTVPGLATPPGAEVVAPQAAMSAGGNLDVVYQSFVTTPGGGYYAIFAQRRNELGWSVPERISVEGNTSVQPVIDVGSDGTACAAWRVGAGEESQAVEVSCLAPGLSWTVPAPVAPEIGDLVNSYDIAVGDGGRPAVIRTMTTSGAPGVTVAGNVRSDAGSWLDTASLSFTEVDIPLSVDIEAAAGGFAAGWYYSEGDFAASWSAGTWSSTGSVFDGAYIPQISLVADADAVTMFAVVQLLGGRSVQARQYYSGAWQEPKTLSQGTAEYSGLAVTGMPNGGAAAVWVSRAEGMSTLQAGIIPVSGEDAVVGNLTSSARPIGSLSVALDPEYVLRAVYSRGRMGDQSVLSQGFRALIQGADIVVDTSTPPTVIRGAGPSVSAVQVVSGASALSAVWLADGLYVSDRVLAPAPPRSLVAKSTERRKVVLTWKVPVSGAPLGYQVEVRSPGGEWRTLGRTDERVYTWSRGTSGVRYQFRVSAFVRARPGTSGLVFGAPSKAAAVTVR